MPLAASPAAISLCRDFFPHAGRKRPIPEPGVMDHFSAITTAEGYRWLAEAMEAQAFAYLALRSPRGLPLT
jgi:hypothetical protein